MTDPLSYLFGLGQFGIKFGLDNMRAIVDRLGHPERAFHAVHVAGTNGKGSVAAMVDAALRRAGHRSARYTSPHLVDLNERFVIDGRPVATREMVEAVEDVRLAVEQLREIGVLQSHPTFFEVTTAVAFELFRRARVEIAVLEVGLGGRLDATNVIQPMMTTITSIALDHEQYLGTTLGQIASEKAGIIKPAVPVVVGRLEPEADQAIEAIARDRGARLVRAQEAASVHRHVRSGTIELRTPAGEYGTLELGLRGAHQVDNAVVAVRVLEELNTLGIVSPPAAIASGLAAPSWPGRLDLRRLADGREILFDAAHNPAGAATLASYLSESGRPSLPLVFAGMRDKDVAGMIDHLAPAVRSIVFTAASNRRSAEPLALVEIARRVAPDLPVTIAASPMEAADRAWQESRRIIVAGSIFLIGDIFKGTGLPVIPFEHGG